MNSKKANNMLHFGENPKFLSKKLREKISEIKYLPKIAEVAMETDSYKYHKTLFRNYNLFFQKEEMCACVKIMCANSMHL